MKPEDFKMQIVEGEEGEKIYNEYRRYAFRPFLAKLIKSDYEESTEDYIARISNIKLPKEMLSEEFIMNEEGNLLSAIWVYFEYFKRDNHGDIYSEKFNFMMEGMIPFLKKNGVRLNDTSFCRGNMLHKMIEYNEHDPFREIDLTLLEHFLKNGVNPNELNYGDESPLSLVFASKILMAHKSEKCLREKSKNITPEKSHACLVNQIEAARLLIKYGAKITKNIQQKFRGDQVLETLIVCHPSALVSQTSENDELKKQVTDLQVELREMKARVTVLESLSSPSIVSQTSAYQKLNMHAEIHCSTPKAADQLNANNMQM